MPIPPGQDARSDIELVNLANRGGPRGADAFEVLYQRHRDWVARIAYRFTRDRDMALDVMQEVFLYLLGKFPGFELTAKLTTFLYPVIKHTAIRAREKAGRSTGTDDLLDDLPMPPQMNPTDSDDIDHVLAGLPGPQREVLLLRFVDGMTIEEVSLALDIPAGTVKSRIHNALRTLREDPATKNFLQA